MKENKVFRFVKRPAMMEDGSEAHSVDSRWVFKRKTKPNGTTLHRARVVSRGFKDKIVYDIKETYAPVSRLPLVRMFLAVANKYDLTVYQIDVETAFLNDELDDDMYMAIYGLRVSPKRWNLRFTEAANKLNLFADDSEPCLFKWKAGDEFVLLLMNVDDILMAGNNEENM